MQLAAFTSDHFPMGHSAMQVNEGHAGLHRERPERRHGTLRGHTVGILGMAFKAESDDNRASLSYKLRKLLALGRRERPLRGPVRPGPALVPLETVLAAADTLFLGVAAPRLPRLDLGDRERRRRLGCLGRRDRRS